METYTIILVFPVLIVAVLFFAEALFVLIKEWISQSTIALTLLCIANGGWLFSFGLMYWSTNPMDAFFWASIGICFTVLISPSAFHFATAVCHTYERRRYWVYGAWLIGFGFVYAQLAHHVMFDEMYQYWFGYYPNYNWPAIIELTYFFGFLLWAIAEFFQIMLTKKPNSRMYYRSYLFGISYSIGSFGAIDILPMWGVPVFPFGFTLLIVSVAMTIYIVTRYRLIDITPYLAANEIVETMVDCLLVCDISDRICVANSAANNTLYSNNQSLRGHKLNEFFSILSFREFLELKNQGDFQNREFWMYERQKGYQQYSISMTHIYDPALEYLIGYIIVARNIQTYKDMQRYQENLASMLLHNPSPVMEFDQTGSLTFANYAAQHLMANW